VANAALKGVAALLSFESFRKLIGKRESDVTKDEATTRRPIWESAGES